MSSRQPVVYRGWAEEGSVERHLHIVPLDSSKKLEATTWDGTDDELFEASRGCSRIGDFDDLVGWVVFGVDVGDGRGGAADAVLVRWGICEAGNEQMLGGVFAVADVVADVEGKGVIGGFVLEGGSTVGLEGVSLCGGLCFSVVASVEAFPDTLSEVLEFGRRGSELYVVNASRVVMGEHAGSSTRETTICERYTESTV
ncbi:hypothetical protein [Natrononativus amylolyticus]|uniref:hypothetical protein n=1 Tax=Natrononativus amylolyticus TaxID=2963434 RepID=UPI0020CE7503|nr:hypothetical protein [Natrononativus amylolyticus]